MKMKDRNGYISADASKGIVQISSQSLKQRMLRRWQLYLMLLIPLLFTFIFAYIPMGGLIIAFKKYNFRDGIFGSAWVGLDNFTKFFKSAYFARTLRNTLTLSIYGLLTFPIPILFALFLNALPGRKYKKIIQTVTYLPHFISTVVIVGLIFQLLNYRSGIYGAIYTMLTGTTAPDILAKGRLFKHIYVWSGVWQNAGYSSIIYIAALAGIDPTLYEAATIDGATRFQRLRYIDIPGIMPTISIMLILAVGHIMSIGFEKAYLMQNNLNIAYSEIISTYVYKVGLASGITDFSYATAIGMFNSVINFALLILANTISKKLSGSGIF